MTSYKFNVLRLALILLLFMASIQILLGMSSYLIIYLTHYNLGKHGYIIGLITFYLSGFFYGKWIVKKHPSISNESNLKISQVILFSIFFHYIFIVTCLLLYIKLDTSTLTDFDVMTAISSPMFPECIGYFIIYWLINRRLKRAKTTLVK